MTTRRLGSYSRRSAMSCPFTISLASSRLFGAFATGCAAVALTCASASAQPLPSAPAPAPPQTDDYTVAPGDSCLSIARRRIGGPQALDELHRLNPQLGATPHKLVPGQTLHLPRARPSSPDANLTAARGDVAVRRPAEASWDQARRGMDLFRAWRVGARERASAEVTFRDNSQLRLRENTIVIIYGPSSQRQPIAALRAELEGGSLEARLAAASQAPPTVLTPSAAATLGRGSSLVSVDAAGTSLVANHAGDPVTVRAVERRVPRGAPVKVASGMGSRVEKGKLPEPPRPLPAAPALAQPALIVPTFGASATVPVQWRAVPEAIRYRVVVLDDAGAEQNAVMIPPGTTSCDLAEVPTGAARVLVSAIDAAGFEGPPAALTVRVATLSAQPPGGAAGAPLAEGKLVVGSRLAELDGVACTLAPLDGSAPPDPVARRLGPHRVYCGTVDSSAAATIEVVGVELALAGASAPVPRDRSLQLAVTAPHTVPGPALRLVASPGLLIEAQSWIGESLTATVRATADAGASATLQLMSGELLLGAVEVPIAAAAAAVAAPTTPSGRARWLLDVGGVAGLVLPPDDAEVGEPKVSRDRLASGALLGARARIASARRPYLAAGLELAAANLSQVGTSRSATLLLSTVSVLLRDRVVAPFELWIGAGLGGAAMLNAPGTTERQSKFTVHAEAGLVVHRAGLAFELNAQLLRLGLVDEHDTWLVFQVGIFSGFGR